MDNYNQILGKQGEALAVDFLKKKKFKILFQNYRCPMGEIDIIAQKKNCFVFCEVKTRTSLAFGKPQEAVTKNKQKTIKLCAKYFLAINNLNEVDYRFDVIEILGGEINHIEFAFN